MEWSASSGGSSAGGESSGGAGLIKFSFLLGAHDGSWATSCNLGEPAGAGSLFSEAADSAGAREVIFHYGSQTYQPWNHRGARPGWRAIDVQSGRIYRRRSQQAADWCGQYLD